MLTERIYELLTHLIFYLWKQSCPIMVTCFSMGQWSQNASSYPFSRRLHQYGQDLLLTYPRVRPWTFLFSTNLLSGLTWPHTFKHHLSADDSQIYVSTWMSKRYFNYNTFSWFSPWTLHFHAMHRTSIHPTGQATNVVILLSSLSIPLSIQ